MEVSEGSAAARVVVVGSNVAALGSRSIEDPTRAIVLRPRVTREAAKLASENVEYVCLLDIPWRLAYDCDSTR